MSEPTKGTAAELLTDEAVQALLADGAELDATAATLLPFARFGAAQLVEVLTALMQFHRVADMDPQPAMSETAHALIMASAAGLITAEYIKRDKSELTIRFRLAEPLVRHFGALGRTVLHERVKFLTDVSSLPTELGDVLVAGVDMASARSVRVLAGEAIDIRLALSDDPATLQSAIGVGVKIMATAIEEGLGGEEAEGEAGEGSSQAWP